MYSSVGHERLPRLARSLSPAASLHALDTAATPDVSAASHLAPASPTAGLLHALPPPRRMAKSKRAAGPRVQEIDDDEEAPEVKGESGDEAPVGKKPQSSGTGKAKAGRSEEPQTYENGVIRAIVSPATARAGSGPCGGWWLLPCGALQPGFHCCARVHPAAPLYNPPHARALQVLENFMNHTHLRVDFDPHVNFIVGKNGSGKSAILNALIAGFGSKASSTGRNTNTAKSLIKSGACLTPRRCSVSCLPVTLCADALGPLGTCPLHTRCPQASSVGCDHATIQIHLANGGLDPYKPSEFGETIIVETRFEKQACRPAPATGQSRHRPGPRRSGGRGWSSAASPPAAAPPILPLLVRPALRGFGDGDRPTPAAAVPHRAPTHTSCATASMGLRSARRSATLTSCACT